MAKLRKVTLTITVEYNPEEWANEYGLDPAADPAGIDGDVAGYIAEQINGHFHMTDTKIWTRAYWKTVRRHLTFPA
jgi:hypothetical protein